MASQYRSVDDSYALSGLAALASDTWRVGLIASREQGDDYRFPGGRAVGTLFERNLYGVHAGYRTGAGELFVEYRRSETDPSGNPAFALDMVYFNTDFVQGGFRGEIADDVALTLRLGHVAVRHLMDNQTLRQPAAAPAQARATFADADTMTGRSTILRSAPMPKSPIASSQLPTRSIPRSSLNRSPMSAPNASALTCNGAAMRARCSLNWVGGLIAPINRWEWCNWDQRCQSGRAASLPRSMHQTAVLLIRPLMPSCGCGPRRGN